MHPVQAKIVVAIPTLIADEALGECLASLDTQTFRDFAVMVVDNSGKDLAARFSGYSYPLLRLNNAQNIGFGAAINQAAANSQSVYIATLNDDCIASPQWLEELLKVADREYEIGLCAAQVRLAGAGSAQRVDSAGMLIARDGSSKQRGFRQTPDRYAQNTEVLCPSGCSALYRRDMLEDIGGFDESFFLYCEDTDLGLRARWAAWQAHYAAKAIVHHRYSHSSAQNAELKAFLIERNRIVTALKNFPAKQLSLVPFAGACRYLFHVFALLRGRGSAAEFTTRGHSPWKLAVIVCKAHWYAVQHWPAIWKARKAVRRRVTPQQFLMAIKRHRISLYEVARL